MQNYIKILLLVNRIFFLNTNNENLSCIYLGIEPTTHSKNLISWFPMFFPIRVNKHEYYYWK